MTAWRDENGRLRGTPWHDYEPPEWSEQDYAQIARLLDQLTADAARNRLQESGGDADDAA